MERDFSVLLNTFFICGIVTLVSVRSQKLDKLFPRDSKCVSSVKSLILLLVCVRSQLCVLVVVRRVCHQT